ncbi:MAG: hypothetical protein HOH95_05780 [Dehalococcoidia bacterium]|jgi:hypothetical protein|nr:hypothetical protein [Dehalococcoidia bacterium]
MTHATARVGEQTTLTSDFAFGTAAAAIAATVFVLLTSSTGATYHLFPLAIAAAPPLLPRLLLERPLSISRAQIAAALGLATVAVAWLTLVLLDEMPHTTLIANQPGGVPGEFVAFGLLGAFAGAWWGSRGS